MEDGRAPRDSRGEERRSKGACLKVSLQAGLVYVIRVGLKDSGTIGQSETANFWTTRVDGWIDMEGVLEMNILRNRKSWLKYCCMLYVRRKKIQWIWWMHVWDDDSQEAM